MTAKRQSTNSPDPGTTKAYCLFCGSTVGQTSDSTGGRVNAVYDCQKCRANYCDQDSVAEVVDGRQVQLCLRCGGKLDKVM